MLAYLLLFIAITLVIFAIRMISHRNKNMIRASGLVLAYVAVGIAMKAYFMLAVLH